MGNKIVAPFPSYESTCAHISSDEITKQKKVFNALRGDQVFNSTFFEKVVPNCSSYLRKHILFRLFQIMDTKKDNVLDFEEYFPVVSFFRVATMEEKAKVLFLMYEPDKSGYLPRQIILDSIMLEQGDSSGQTVTVLEEWIGHQRDLANGLVDLALFQFSAQDGKIDMADFIAFARTEGSILGLMNALQAWVEF